MTIQEQLYPNFFKVFDQERFEFQAKLWQRSLSNVSWSEAVTALEIWYNTQPKPPSLAEFKPLVSKNKNPQAFLSAENAWETVDKAVRKYGSYNQEKAFETFSEPIKRAVRNVGGWQKICATELGQSWDFLRKNFMESYQDFGSEEKEQHLLPPQILKRLQQLTNEPKKLGEAE